MVIDSSAIIAILAGEPEGSTFTDMIGDHKKRAISAATFLEISIVLCRRAHPEDARRLNDFIERMKITVIPVTESQARLAAEAFRSYGKGRHPAGLNFGDCFSYALALERGEKLLFKGDDFSRTDIQPACPA